LKKLENILNNIIVLQHIGSINVSIKNIAFDSREVTENTLFVAQKGSVVDGHKFIDNAIKLGAKVIVCENLPTNLDENITYIQVEDSNKALAHIASNFYQNPSSKLKLIGVTGTNGKTTIATLLYNLFKKVGYKVGLLSTVKVLINNEAYKATHTTPNSIAINNYLNEMVNADVDYCFMEVSSHGIHQKRIEGLHFEGGIFTNLTHDHLDYHNSFKEYRDVKKAFFDNLPKTAFALVNSDDKNGKFMVQNTKAKVHTYALKTLADFKAKILENEFSGLLLNINNAELWVKLVGSFNAYNILAVYGTAQLLGLEKTETLTYISELNNVSGRFEYVVSKSNKIAVVDYAHTPDALTNVLETVNDIKKNDKKIITVVGCGGDRDKAKRPVMGRIASQLSNQVVFTSDNPRTENPETILKEIENGVSKENNHKILTIENRKQAIKTAVKIAKSGDVILIAGKGHETYQEINGVRTHFDDMEEVTNAFKTLED